MVGLGCSRYSAPVAWRVIGQQFGSVAFELAGGSLFAVVCCCHVGGSFSRAIACANAPLAWLVVWLVVRSRAVRPPAVRVCLSGRRLFNTCGRSPFTFLPFGRCTSALRHDALPTFPCVTPAQCKPIRGHECWLGFSIPRLSPARRTGYQHYLVVRS